jgi:hypothetical protein
MNASSKADAARLPLGSCKPLKILKRSAPPLGCRSVRSVMHNPLISYAARLPLGVARNTPIPPMRFRGRFVAPRERNQKGKLEGDTG